MLNEVLKINKIIEFLKKKKIEVAAFVNISEALSRADIRSWDLKEIEKRRV